MTRRRDRHEPYLPEQDAKRQPGDGHYLGPVEGAAVGADHAEQAIGAEPAQHRARGLGYDDDEQISRLLQRRIGVRGLLR